MTENEYLGVEASAEFTRLLIEGDVIDWAGFLQNGDYQKDYRLLFGVIASDMACLLLPADYCIWIMTWIIETFITGDTRREFLINSYLSSISDAMKNVHVEFFDYIKMIMLIIGFIHKVIFAFLFKENTIDFAPLTWDFTLFLAGYYMPFYNFYANLISGNILPSDWNFWYGSNVYPGDWYCRHQ